MYKLFVMTAALIILLLMGGALLARNSNVWDKLLFDVYAQWFSPTLTSDVIYIKLDDTSIAEHGGWSWPRGVHAQLIERVQAANVIAYDIAFIGTSASPAQDLLLEKAAKRVQNLVLPLLAERNTQTGQLHTLFPFGELQTSATLAHSDMPQSSDNRFITLYLKAGNANAQYPLFAQAVAQQESDAILSFSGVRPGHQRKERAGLWVRDYANLLATRVNFDSVQSISASRVLEGSIPVSTFAGKTVFVGIDSNVLAPKLTLAGFDGKKYSDAQIQIHIYEAIKQNTLIKRYSNVWAFWLAALAVVLAVVVIRYQAWIVGRVLAGMLLVFVLFAVPILLAKEGIWIMQGYGLLGAMLVLTSGMMCRVVYREYFKLSDGRPAGSEWLPQSYHFITEAKNRGDVLGMALLEIDHFDRFSLDHSPCDVARAYMRVVFSIKVNLRRLNYTLEHFDQAHIAIIMSGDTKTTVTQAMKKVVYAVEDLNINHASSTVKPSLTVSIGGSVAMPNTDIDMPLLFGNAEAALSQAVAKGRNQLTLLN